MTGTAMSSTRVAVAVATYRRPDCLSRILPALARQLASSPHTGKIFVVDNDPAGGAAAIVAALGISGLQYSHEPEPGISAARNHAVRMAQGFDLIIFIDDDEMPAEHWLDRLVDCWAIYECVGVAGPAKAQFTEPVDPWVLATGVFDRRTIPTGTVVVGAASNNLLLDLRQLNLLGLGFDVRFGISGGSDTMLTRAISRAGGIVRWCDEAEVLDLIPVSRTTRSWAIRRTFRTSNTWSRVHLALATSTAERIRQRGSLCARGITRIVTGALELAAGLISRSIPMRARGTCAVTSGAAMFLGAFGFIWHEYRRTKEGPHSATISLDQG